MVLLLVSGFILYLIRFSCFFKLKNMNLKINHHLANIYSGVKIQKWTQMCTVALKRAYLYSNTVFSKCTFHHYSLIDQQKIKVIICGGYNTLKTFLFLKLLNLTLKNIYYVEVQITDLRGDWSEHHMQLLNPDSCNCGCLSPPTGLNGDWHV